MPGILASQKSDDAQNASPIIGIQSQEKKICQKCWVEKRTDEFSKDKKRVDGLKCYCKQCDKEYNHNNYLLNRDKILQRNQKWFDNNPERRIETNKQWRANNPEKARKIARKSVAKWRSTPEGKQKNIQWKKDWIAKNSEQHKKYLKEYYQDNKELCDKLRRKSEIKRLYGLDIDDYEIMVGQQNNKCYICGQSPKKNALAVDHDHQTGKIRKLLCSGCNHHVGIIEKGEDYLISLVRYLAEHESEMAINLLKKLEAT